MLFEASLVGSVNAVSPGPCYIRATPTQRRCHISTDYVAGSSSKTGRGPGI